MKSKKVISFILCFLLFFSIMPSPEVLAAMKNMKFNKGTIEMQFEDTKATTGTTYHTVGWLIHPTERPNRDAYNQEKVGVMVGSDFQETDSENLGNGKVLSTFRIDSNSVDFALAAAQMGGIKEGETVYLDSVFEVLKNGQSTGRYYYTYNDIASAASWGSGTLEDLKSYYNRKIQYSSADHPLTKKVIVNGQELSSEQITKSKTGVVHNVTFEPTVNYDGGVATIKKSYFYYDIEKGNKLFELDSSDNRVLNRNATMYAGGITVVAEYQIDPKVKVEHFNLDTNSMIEVEPEYTVKSGSTVTKSAKSYKDVGYAYSEVSENNGSTWKERHTNSTRNIIVNRNTVIRFNYAKDTSLMAALTLTADPNIIDEGKTATVTFGLDASQSKAKKGIAKYEFWFSSTPTFEEKPNWTITSNYKETKQSKVKPDTTWYGKVRITDKEGKTAIATAEVTIESQQAEPEAEIEPRVKLSLAGENRSVLSFTEAIEGLNGLCIPLGGTDNNGYTRYRAIVPYYMDILVDDDYRTHPERYEDMEITVQLDASESTSTNNIGKYDYLTNYHIYNNSNGTYSQLIQSTGSSVSKPFEIQLGLSPADVESGKFSNKYEDSTTEVYCRMADSTVESCNANVIVEIQYRFVFNTAPDVLLDINSNSFGLGETAIFTPTFIEGSYPINSKSWSIQKNDSDFIISGNGEIPREYRISLAEGDYTARQYITYKDRQSNDITDYAEVIFNVYTIKPPTVDIASDKDKYFIPTTGVFTVTYSEENKYTYQIVDREYTFRTEDGSILEKDKGTFPETFNFSDTLASGYYVAAQTIYWWESGEYKSATAECKFKLISPRPASEFRVDMKITNNPTWNRIDVPGESGKVFKQIRIDLSPSIELNESLENPLPIDFTSLNTQIQIIPLNEDGQEDKIKNSTIHTPKSEDKKLVNDIVTFQGKQFIDIRFDSPGKYKIKVCVANKNYTGNWIFREITIREDLAPKTYLSFENVIIENEQNKVYRNADDLKVRFKVKTKSFPQDEDTINSDNAKLQVRFDYNSDGDTSNDNLHSDMIFSKSVNTLQPYIKIQGNNNMDEFDVEMYSDSFPLLGKVQFEYFVSETPKIPNFTGGIMPNIPELYGDTLTQPIEEKLVWADNKPGNIKIELGKESKIEVTVIMGTDTAYFDVNALKSYFGEDARIYVITKNGDRQIIN